MNRSTKSWFSILGVLGAMFGLMSMAVDDDIRAIASLEPVHRQTPAAAVAPTSAPILLPTVVVVASAADLAAADAMAAAEHAALTVALIPAPIREAQAQLQKASAVSRRASRVSLRLPYYAFGPDPVSGSK